MLVHDVIQSECLSLVAGLYGAISDGGRYADRRAECEAWLGRQVAPDTPAVRFLRTQMARATEALALTCRAGAAVPSACAVVTVDDRGRLIAAGAEAWTLLRSGSAAEDPLRLPSTLRAFIEDASLGPSVPRALRVPLDDGSSELAGIVLGVDEVHHAIGSMRVITLLLCEVGGRDERAAAPAPRPRGEVREFRRAASPSAAAPYTVGLAADRSA
jgi:hypothetical protein